MTWALHKQAKFTTALDFWGDIITGYRDGISRTWNLTVNTFSTPASSGGGIILGSPGPSGAPLVSGVVTGSGLSAPWTDRFLLSPGGNANFNVHPDAGGGNINNEVTDNFREENSPSFDSDPGHGSPAPI